MLRLTVFLGLFLFGMSGAAMAAGSSSGGGSSSSSASAGSADFSNAATLIKQGHYDAAVPLLEKAVAAEPKNPDYLTELAYVYRKTGKLNDSYDYYDRALAVDANHKGALNYLGILYLQTDQVDKAKEMLARLDSACFFGCEEYDDLKAAIEGGAGNY